MAHRRARARHRYGSVLPFVAIGLPVIFAFLACAIDLTRNITAVRKLQFAADTAGIYAASFATNADGSYNPNTARLNMTSALTDANGNGSAWNTAPAGAANGPKSSLADVTFAGADVNFVTNPGDQTETLVQVAARRTGQQALQQLFAPVLTGFGRLIGQAPSTNQNVVSPAGFTEVIGQPASRVGAAVPRTVNGGIRSLAPYGVFPLAISNKQFAAAATSATNTIVSARLFSSALSAQPVPANTLNGALVNIAPSATTGQAYGQAQGNAGIDQLLGTVKYFYNQVDNAAIPPAAVERGGAIGAFNTADATFQTRWSASIAPALSQIKQPQWLILPVISADPSFSNTNTVVGFARVQLTGISGLGADPTTARFSLLLGESVPLRNVSANNWTTIPRVTGSALPPPVAPFAPRTYSTVDGSVSSRPVGVVMAPVLSPRKVTGWGT